MEYEIYNTDELYHHGVKGMKWGIRRYQNKDGSLTPAGQKRYDRDIKDNLSKKKDNRIVIDGPDPSRWSREDTSRQKNVVDATSKAVKELKDINDNIWPSPKKKSYDLSKMSDKELRDTINRANLERQYNDLQNKEYVNKGRVYINDVLNTAGTVLAIGSSALGIALSIKELRG